MAKGTNKTTSTDRGEKRIKELIADMKRSKEGPHVKVGILESSGMHNDADGRTVVQVALDNEFGTDRIPERAFMRTSGKELVGIMAELEPKLLAKVVAGEMTMDHALDVIGMKAQTVIKKTIDDWEIPPNAPSTIARKGANNPLVDTGQMRNSVQYEKVK